MSNPDTEKPPTRKKQRKQRRYSKTIQDTIRELYPHHSSFETTRLLNERLGTDLSREAVRAWATRNRVRQLKTTRRRTRCLLNEEQETLFRALYKTYAGGTCARILNLRFGTNHTASQIKRFAITHKIGADRHYNAGHFSALNPGFRPAKGVRMSKETEFKKGDIPKNTVPLFTQRTNRDGHIEIKVPKRNPYTGAATRFVALARWRWEQAHGDIPKGMSVVHVDGNKTNNGIDNLTLLTRAELLTLNNPRKVPVFTKPELNGQRIALARLITATEKRERER